MLGKQEMSLVAFVLLTSSLYAQNLQVKAVVNPSQIHIGDRFHYHLEVTAAESLAVDLPELVGNLGSFEVKDMKITEGKPTQGSKTHNWDLTLSTFVGGDFVLPPQVVVAWKGKDSLLTRTEPVTVRVLGRLNEKDEDILDVEPPVKDPHTPWWVWVLVAIPVLALLVFGGRWLWKRLRQMAVVPLLPPYEEALQAIKDLRSRNLLENQEQAEHFFALGQILRRYIHRQYRGDVVDATTQELPTRMESVQGIGRDWCDAWIDFAKDTDMVKFAKVTLPTEECARLEKFADDFLMWNHPAPEEKK